MNNKYNRSRSEANRKRGYYKRNEKKGFEPKVPDAADNDIGWYMKDPALVAQAGKVSFNTPLGASLPRTVLEDRPGVDNLPEVVQATNEELSYATPGIFRLAMSPAFGVSTNAQSPINVAARALFSAIQSTLNMKLAPAIEAPDLMCYLGCADSLDSFYAWVARLYGTVADENVLNKYRGMGLVTANGVDYDDLRKHLPDMLFFLKYFRQKVNTGVVLPKGFGFAQRHFWLFSNYFKDSPVEKAQIYVHTPVGFYMWNPTGYETGTCMDFESFAKHVSNVNAITWSEIETYGHMLLDAMLMDQDANSISGFILRGWGSDGCTQLPEVPDNYSVEPIYSEEILGQIHNSQCLGLRVTPTTVQYYEHLLDYYQKQEGDSWLYCQPKFRVKRTWTYAHDEWTADSWTDSSAPVGIFQSVGLSLYHLMDSFVDDPSAQEIIINSRNMMSGHFELDPEPGSITPAPTSPYTQYKYAVVDDCGLDIIWFYQIFTFDDNYEVGASEVATFMGENVSSTVGVTAPEGVALGLLSKFDWAPRIVCGSYKEATNQLILAVDSWDYNNTTSVSYDALHKMHLAALNGAFDLGIRVNGYDKLTTK